MPGKLNHPVLVAAIAPLVVLLGAVEANAQEPPSPDVLEVNVAKVRDNRTLRHSVEGGAGDSDAERTRGRAPARRRPVARQVFYASFPIVVLQPDGSRCVRSARRAYPSELSASIAPDTENILWRLLVESFPLCPNAPLPESTPPAARAAEYWRVVGEDLLPKPSPRIAPGYMLAGKLAYLEAGTVPTARFEHPTPAGVLTIEASARHWVDWDDGSSLSGPFDHPGGPWPHGTITHYWTHVGHYDVRVIQRWTGRWILGTESGALAGLETEGVIEDFPVEEVQAVINR